MQKLEQKKSFKSLYRFDLGLQAFPERFPEDLFESPPRGSILERYVMYGNGFLLRSEETLTQTFEALSNLMGENSWSELVKAYVSKYLSQSYNLEDVCYLLPKFLREEGYDPKWVELADLEILIAESFHAPEMKNEILEEDLKAISEETIFLFQPAVKLFQSDFRAVSAWKKRAEKIPLEPTKEFGAIYRKDFLVYLYLLEEPEFQLLSDLKEGLSLGDAVSKLETELTPEQLSSYLHHWIQYSFFYGVS